MNLNLKVDIASTLSAFNAMIEANGSDVDVKLRSSGETATIRMSDIGRRVDDMTEGLQQNSLVMRCMAAAWDGALPRSPEKGDQITVAGRRYAVEWSRLSQFQGTRVGYVLRMKG